MSYSKEQIQDLLHLRRLFYGRQGVLDRQRRDLVGKLSSNEAMVMTDSPPQSNYSVLTSISHELRANAAEEHCLRLQCCCACFRGVSGFIILSVVGVPPAVAVVEAFLC